MCFLQSTVRAEVTFVPSTKGIERSGNDSGAHGKLEQASQKWAMPSGARLRGSVQRSSRNKADEDRPLARGDKAGGDGQGHRVAAGLGFLPLLCAGLFPAVPGASFQEVVWGLRTGTEHCPNESWGPPSH